MRIADRLILSSRRVKSPHSLTMPLIIAKVDTNHEGSIDIAKRLIEEAAEGGAHAIKFQAFTAEKLAVEKNNTENSPASFKYSFLKKYDSFGKNEFEELKNHCDAVGIEFLATPYDIESAKFLNELMEVFKISSGDITNKPFIQYLCSFGKPVILGTGGSYPYEISEAVSWIEPFNIPLALLHSVLNHPTADHNASLSIIPRLAELFPEHTIGYSDNTMPDDMKALEIASLVGAKIIEKHFTHDKSLPGNMHYHAMDKNDLRNFKASIERTIALMGDGNLMPLPSEEDARHYYRRSLVAQMNIKKGEKLSPKHITWKRPAKGISPVDYEKVLGKTARQDISKNDFLDWSLFE